MKRRFVLLSFAILAALPLLGLLVAASGILPVRASEGHWKITEWFLRFGMHRSAATHSLAVKVPPLDSPGMILKGAGHFEFNCRTCHGAPGMRPAPVMQEMLPRPVDLVEAVPKLEAKKLFYIVKHGVKFTGMPAFASQQRDDEVWAVVAFLQQLPSLTPADYERLVGRQLPPPESQPGAAAETAFLAVNRSCIQCHGVDGQGRGDSIPRLAGQKAAYLENALHAYAGGHRHSGIMEPIAVTLEPPMIRQLVEHYAGIAPKTVATPETLSAEKISRGAVIAREGIAERRIPACLECHGPPGRQTNPAYPRLAGQSPEFLRAQLQLLQEGNRGGSVFLHLMQPIADRLELEEIDALAHYFASLAPDAESP